jgi:hypothetical protein
MVNLTGDFLFDFDNYLKRYQNHALVEVVIKTLTVGYSGGGFMRKNLREALKGDDVGAQDLIIMLVHYGLFYPRDRFYRATKKKTKKILLDYLNLYHKKNGIHVDEEESIAIYQR